MLVGSARRMVVITGDGLMIRVEVVVLMLVVVLVVVVVVA